MSDDTRDPFTIKAQPPVRLTPAETAQLEQAIRLKRSQYGRDGTTYVRATVELEKFLGIRLTTEVVRTVVKRHKLQWFKQREISGHKKPYQHAPLIEEPPALHDEPEDDDEPATDTPNQLNLFPDLPDGQRPLVGAAKEWTNFRAKINEMELVLARLEAGQTRVDEQVAALLNRVNWLTSVTDYLCDEFKVTRSMVADAANRKLSKAS